MEASHIFIKKQTSFISLLFEGTLSNNSSLLSLNYNKMSSVEDREQVPPDNNYSATFVTNSLQIAVIP